MTLTETAFSEVINGGTGEVACAEVHTGTYALADEVVLGVGVLLADGEGEGWGGGGGERGVVGGFGAGLGGLGFALCSVH